MTKRTAVRIGRRADAAPFLGVLILLLLLVLVRGDSSAQEIHGRVSDAATGEPLEGVLMRALDSEGALLGVALSDSSGVFRIRMSGCDSVKVRAERLGYAWIESLPLAISGARPLELEFRMRPQPPEMDEVVATVERRVNENLEGFLRRQRFGFGRYLGPAEIAEMRLHRASHALHGLSGAQFVPVGHGIQAVPRGPTSLTRAGPYCDPHVYVDGLPIEERFDEFRTVSRSRGVPIDRYVPARALRAVEVYVNPAQAPPQFQIPFGSSCPVVVMWTDYGFGVGYARTPEGGS